jgi:hypothetical protein
MLIGSCLRFPFFSVVCSSCLGQQNNRCSILHGLRKQTTHFYHVAHGDIKDIAHTGLSHPRSIYRYLKTYYQLPPLINNFLFIHISHPIFRIARITGGTRRVIVVSTSPWRRNTRTSRRTSSTTRTSRRNTSSSLHKLPLLTSYCVFDVNVSSAQVNGYCVVSYRNLL